MGTRLLPVSAEMLVEFLRNRDGRERSYTVANALPDDVELVRVHADEYRANVKLVVRSAEWADDVIGDLEATPQITVRFTEGTTT